MALERFENNLEVSTIDIVQLNPGNVFAVFRARIMNCFTHELSQAIIGISGQST